MLAATLAGPGTSAETAPEFVRLGGGSFLMGSRDHYAEERSVHRVQVDPFLISATEVTNAQFAAFVADTGYVTTAERWLNPADHHHLPPELLEPG